jgi:hypothetical protein
VENLSAFNAGKLPTHLWRTCSVRIGLRSVSGAPCPERKIDFTANTVESFVENGQRAGFDFPVSAEGKYLVLHPRSKIGRVHSVTNTEPNLS